MNIDETFFAFLSGIFASYLFREFIGVLRVFLKNEQKGESRKLHSLAEKYEDALLFIRDIAVSALYSDNIDNINALEDIHQKVAQSLWGQKNEN